MMGQYALVDDLQLQRFLTVGQEELVDQVEELYDTAVVNDMDNFWDGLHYLLTGVPANQAPQGDLCSLAVLGETLFSEDEDTDYIAYTRRSSLPGILAALEVMDEESLKRRFSVKKMEAAGVYPGVWSKEEASLLWESLREEHQNLVCFYRQAIAENKNVIVSIY